MDLPQVAMCADFPAVLPRSLMAWTACVLLASASAVAARAEATVDKDGRFVATFPGPVVRSSQPAGNSTLHIVNFDENNMTSYFVMYGDHPEGTWARLGGVDNSYERAVSGAMKAQGGTLLSRASCRTGNFEGREFLIDIPSKKLVCRVRYYIVGNRLYQVMYVGEPGTHSQKKVDAFLDSFRILAGN